MITQMRTEQGTKNHFFLDARVRSPRVQEFDEKPPTISDLCVPEEEFIPFYGAAVQSQQVGAMA